MKHTRAPQSICGALALLGVLAALALLTSGCAGLRLTDGPGGPAADAGTAGGAETAGERGTYGDSAVAESEWHGLPHDMPYVRVGLAHGVRSASVSCTGGFTVGLYADSLRNWTAGAGDRWLFGAAEDGVTGSGPGGGFHMDDGTIRIRPDEGEFVVFDETRYRGEVELFSSGESELTVVNVLGIESYLRGVVPREIGRRPESEIEAVKAQAVAARTYAIASGGRRAEGGFDVYATVDDQVYEGVDGEDAVCDRAILETAGIFITHSGEPIHAYFHSNCGGSTEARHEVWELPEVPYLKQIWDSPDRDRFSDPFCSADANFAWSETWDAGEIEQLVREHLPNLASTPVQLPLRELKGMRVTARTPSGRVRWLEVTVGDDTYRVFGDRVRWLMRRQGSNRILRSAFFDLEALGRGDGVSGVTVEGRGYGHGIGLCQHGAMEMARRGYRYEDILRHYYSGVKLERSYGSEP